MRSALITCAGVLFTLAAAAAQQESPVKYVPASEMAAFFAKGGTVSRRRQLHGHGGAAHGDRRSRDARSRHRCVQDHVGFGHIRDGRPHVGAHTTEPGETRGTGIEGGQTRQLSAGDVIVIEKGVPHWFKTIEGRLEYFVVKVR